MEAHCSTGAPCGTVKEASFFYLRNRCHAVFKKKPHRVFSLRIYYLLLKYITFTLKRQHHPRKYLFFSTFTDCVFLQLYNMFQRLCVIYSEFSFWQRSFLYTLTARFMILCAHRAQLCRKIRLFCCISLFLRNFLFRMCLLAAGPGGWVGALWEGWQVCGARFPFFRGAMGTPRPCKRFAVFAAAGVCLVDCTPANGTPFSLYNGVRVCCRYAIRFFVPPALPLIPGSPLPISICASS